MEYKTLIKGIYDKVFKQNDYKFQSVPLSSVCTIKKGEQLNTSKLLSRGDFYVMNGGILPSGYNSRYNTEANVISISEGGNSCGYVQYNHNRFWSGGHCYTLHNIINGIENKYLYFYLKAMQENIMKLRVGSGLPNIQKKDLDRFNVLIPPLENQKKIATTLDIFSIKLKVEKDMVTAFKNQKQYFLDSLFI